MYFILLSSLNYVILVLRPFCKINAKNNHLNLNQTQSVSLQCTKFDWPLETPWNEHIEIYIHDPSYN